MKPPTFADWPRESIEKMCAIIAHEIASGIRRDLGLPAANSDMEYIASLPPNERKAALKEMRK